MVKMIIVDDNPWERDGIKGILDWDRLGIEIVGMYPNGDKALKDFKAKSPDIILTDIFMPVLSGLELAKAIKRESPAVIILFMTAYNEFEYAKTAIDLNVYGFILKPIIKEELERVVTRALKAREREASINREREDLKKKLKEYLPFIREQYLKEYLFGAYKNHKEIVDRFAFLDIGIEGFSEVQVICISPIELQGESDLPDASNKFYIQYALKEIISAHRRADEVWYPVLTAPDEISVLVFFRAGAEADGASELIDSIISIKEKAESELNISATVGISLRSANLMDSPILYRQSAHAAKTKLYGSLSHIIRYGEIESLQNNDFGRSLDIQILYRELTELISLGDENDIMAFVEKYLPSSDTVLSENYIKSFAFSVVNMLHILLIEFGESFRQIFDDEMAVWNKLVNFDTIKDVRRWIFNIVRMIKSHINASDQNIQRQPVQKIITYIKQNYDQQITIGEIAQTVHFSAIHANNLFKKETGKTIFDYLIEYRIEMAKELLKDPQSRVYLVSEQVGYANKSYFCELFKRHTGLAPMEYKKRVLI